MPGVSPNRDLQIGRVVIFSTPTSCTPLQEICGSLGQVSQILQLSALCPKGCLNRQDSNHTW